MTSRVLNFLWLNLDFPASQDADAPFIDPMPANYIQNVIRSGDINPDTNVHLWVDSKRLTSRQMNHLKKELSSAPSNVDLKDLRSIPEYDAEGLYNKQETTRRWRTGGQDSIIWRQVDAAKVLVCLQGNFDQVFFADLDLARLETASAPVQKMLQKHGILVGESPTAGGFENQMWGFDQRQRDFFEQLYRNTINWGYGGTNGFYVLLDALGDLEIKQGIDGREICFSVKKIKDGSCAHHPGHEWEMGCSTLREDLRDLKRFFMKALARPASKKTAAQSKAAGPVL